MITDIKTQLINPLIKKIDKIKELNSGGISKKLLLIPIFGIIYALYYIIMLFLGYKKEVKLQTWLSLVFIIYQWLMILTVAFLWLFFIYLSV